MKAQKPQNCVSVHPECDMLPKEAAVGEQPYTETPNLPVLRSLVRTPHYCNGKPHFFCLQRIFWEAQRKARILAAFSAFTRPSSTGLQACRMHINHVLAPKPMMTSCFLCSFAEAGKLRYSLRSWFGCKLDWLLCFITEGRCEKMTAEGLNGNH